jgi:hypothetical protein
VVPAALEAGIDAVLGGSDSGSNAEDEGESIVVGMVMSRWRVMMTCRKQQSGRGKGVVSHTGQHKQAVKSRA